MLKNLYLIDIMLDRKSLMQDYMYIHLALPIFKYESLLIFSVQYVKDKNYELNIFISRVSISTNDDMDYRTFA